MVETRVATEASPAEERKPFRWGFPSAAGLILLVLCAGQAVAFVLEDFHPFPLGAMRARDGLFLAFLASTAVFLVLQRAAVARFFRSMHAGVALIVLVAIAVTTGVLVPQIEGFEDATVRVPRVSDIPESAIAAGMVAPKEAREKGGMTRRQVLAAQGLTRDQAERADGYIEEYQTFRWAEGYFLYHLSHVYGIGMPQVPLPAFVEASLERFGDRYGKEERDNRHKQMLAAFSGMEKTKQIRALIDRHDTTLRRAFDVCTALHLNRTYKSGWFATLLSLLAAGVLFNSFRFSAQKTLSLKKIGFFTVHMGVLTILAGGAWSKLKSDRGILHMDLREGQKDVYYAYQSPDKPTRMPFALKLERFARKDWPTLEVGFFEDDFKANLPEYTLWPGREIDLDYTKDESGARRPRIHLKVQQLAARARIDPRFWEAEDRQDKKGLGALAEVEVDANPPSSAGDGGASSAGQTVILKPDYPRYMELYDPRWMFRVRSSYGPDPETARAQLLAPTTDVIGALLVRATTAGEVEPTRYPFKLGQKIEVPGGFTLEVQEATARFQLDRDQHEIRDSRPLEQQYPANPAVWVRITPKDGGVPERRLLLEGLDWSSHPSQEKFTYKDLLLNVEWERWTSKGPPRFVLHWQPDGKAFLLGEDGSTQAVSAGAPLPLPGETRVVPSKLMHNALYDRKIEFLAKNIEGPRFDADFYADDPTGLEIEVTSNPGTPRESKEVVRMATAEENLADLWRSPDSRFWLRFYGNDKALPFEWRSVLSVWQKDADGKPYKVDLGPEEKREIRVNDYFYYRGFRFFQTNALAEMPTYSGIGVVYDPGIPIVLMGMYLTIVGAILAFIVRPIVESLGAGQPGAEGTGKRPKEATA